MSHINKQSHIQQDKIGGNNLRIETDKLAKAIKLSQGVTSGRLKSDIPELQMLSLIIRESRVYVLAQGDSGVSTVRMMAKVGTDSEVTHANYIINGDRLLRVLNECEDETVQVIFGDHSVEVFTSLGLTRYESVAENLQTDFNIGTNYEHVFEDINDQIEFTQEEGQEIENSTWRQGLDVLRASSTDTESVSLIFYEDHVLLRAPYADVRYKTDFPFTLPLPIEVAKVMQDIVKYDDSQSKAYTEGEVFSYVSDNVYIGVYGIGRAFQSGQGKAWDISTDDGVEVRTEELRRVVRVSDIFLSTSGEDIIFEFKYEDNKLRVLNKEEDGYGADLTLDMETESTKEQDTIQVLGEVLQKTLVLTEDDTVEIELLGGNEGLHLVFNEGDAHLSYIE